MFPFLLLLVGIVTDVLADDGTTLETIGQIAWVVGAVWLAIFLLFFAGIVGGAAAITKRSSKRTRRGF